MKLISSMENDTSSTSENNWFLLEPESTVEENNATGRTTTIEEAPTTAIPVHNDSSPATTTPTDRALNISSSLSKSNESSPSKSCSEEESPDDDDGKYGTLICSGIESDTSKSNENDSTIPKTDDDDDDNEQSNTNNATNANKSSNNDYMIISDTSIPETDSFPTISFDDGGISIETEDREFYFHNDSHDDDDNNDHHINTTKNNNSDNNGNETTMSNQNSDDDSNTTTDNDNNEDNNCDDSNEIDNIVINNNNNTVQHHQKKWLTPAAAVFLYIVGTICCGIGYLCYDRNVWKQNAKSLEQEIKRLQVQQEEQQQRLLQFQQQEEKQKKTSTTIIDNCWIQAKANVDLGDCGQETKEYMQQLSDSVKNTIGSFLFWNTTAETNTTTNDDNSTSTTTRTKSIASNLGGKKALRAVSSLALAQVGRHLLEQYLDNSKLDNDDDFETNLKDKDVPQSQKAKVDDSPSTDDDKDDVQSNIWDGTLLDGLTENFLFEFLSDEIGKDSKKKRKQEFANTKTNSNADSDSWSEDILGLNWSEKLSNLGDTFTSTIFTEFLREEKDNTDKTYDSNSNNNNNNYNKNTFNFLKDFEKRYNEFDSRLPSISQLVKEAMSNTKDFLIETDFLDTLLKEGYGTSYTDSPNNNNNKNKNYNEKIFNYFKDLEKHYTEFEKQAPDITQLLKKTMSNVKDFVIETDFLDTLLQEGYASTSGNTNDSNNKNSNNNFNGKKKNFDLFKEFEEKTKNYFFSETNFGDTSSSKQRTTTSTTNDNDNNDDDDWSDLVNEIISEDNNKKRSSSSSSSSSSSDSSKESSSSSSSSSKRRKMDSDKKSSNLRSEKNIDDRIKNIDDMFDYLDSIAEKRGWQNEAGVCKTGPNGKKVCF